MKTEAKVNVRNRFATFNKGTFLIGYWKYTNRVEKLSPFFVHWFGIRIKLWPYTAYRSRIFDCIIAKIKSSYIWELYHFVGRWLTFCDFFFFSLPWNDFVEISLKIISKRALCYAQLHGEFFFQVHHRFINENVCLYSINFWSALIQFKSNFCNDFTVNRFLLSLLLFFSFFLSFYSFARSWTVSLYWCAGLIDIGFSV